MENKLDKRYLKGLKFNGKQIVEKGKKKTQPFSRALLESDVLSYVDKGDVVIIVAADGKKHRVNKTAAAD